MKKNKRNAVLYKEMTVDMKRPKIMIIMLLINLGLVPVALGFFGGNVIAGFFFSSSYRTIAWYFITMVYLEALILVFLTPAITAGSVSLEKERQTLDVLLTTRMTPWEIIKGKYFSQLIFLALMLVSTFPLLSLVFIYGGVSIWSMILVGISLVVCIAFFASFGVFFSALTKNTVLSVIISYIVLFLYLYMTIFLPIFFVGGIEIINGILYEEIYTLQNEHLINGDIFCMLGVLNPLVMIYDSVGNAIGYSFGDFSINGMASTLGVILPHFTEKNILLKLWTPISIVTELLITYGLLRLSAVLLNPLKGKKKKKRKAVKKQ